MASYGIQPPVTFPCRKSQSRGPALQWNWIPNLAEAQTSYGLALAANDFNWSDSEASFRRALQLNRQYAPAHVWFAFRVLTPLKRYEEALIEVKRAIELEPNGHSPAQR